MVGESGRHETVLCAFGQQNIRLQLWAVSLPLHGARSLHVSAGRVRIHATSRVLAVLPNECVNGHLPQVPEQQHHAPVRDVRADMFLLWGNIMRSLCCTTMRP